MCHLMCAPGGVTPSAESLLNACSHNSDGFGWAIVSGTRVITGHSLDAELSIDDFLAARSRYSEGSAMFHARWATHGSIKVDNCHPFQVGSDTRTYLAHNGILGGKCIPKMGDDRSDSRKFAQSILPKWLKRNGFDSLAVKNSMNQTLAGHNKVVILTANPLYRNQHYIFGEALGTWSDGVWHSNGDFRTLWSPTVSRFSVGGKYGWSNDDTYWSEGWDWQASRIGQAAIRSSESRGNLPGAPGCYEPSDETCPMCDEAGGVDPISRVCWACDTCLDCFGPEMACLCYTPHSAARDRAEWASKLRGSARDESPIVRQAISLTRPIAGKDTNAIVRYEHENCE